MPHRPLSGHLGKQKQDCVKTDTGKIRPNILWRVTAE